MKKARKFIIILVASLIVLAVASYIIFPGLWSYYSIFPKKETAFGFSARFAFALRLNDSIAYELSDPSLWPRIDQWMEEHEAQTCVRVPDEQFPGGGNKEHSDVWFYCYLEKGEYRFNVLDIIIEEQEGNFYVVDWGEVIEEFPN